ncbi:MAG: FecR family protein [Bdellovibrionota bacterium]
MTLRNLFKRSLVFTGSAAVLLSASDWAGRAANLARAAESTGKKGLVTYVEGQAQHRAGEKSWDPLQTNEGVESGETVQTKRKTRAEIELDPAKVVRLDENTIVDLVKLFEEEQQKKAVTLEVDQGQVWSQLASLGGDESFKISSPLAAASVRGTVFNFGVGSSGKSTQVDVFSGSVEVYNPFPTQKYTPGMPGGFQAPRQVQGPQQVAGPKEVSLEEWYYIVREMQRIRITQGQTQFDVQDIPADEKAGSWRKWNEERDRLRAARMGHRPISEPPPPTPPAPETPAAPQVPSAPEAPAAPMPETPAQQPPAPEAPAGQ